MTIHQALRPAFFPLLFEVVSNRPRPLKKLGIIASREVLSDRFLYTQERFWQFTLRDVLARSVSGKEI